VPASRHFVEAKVMHVISVFFDRFFFSDSLFFFFFFFLKKKKKRQLNIHVLLESVAKVTMLSPRPWSPLL
jgi:hypothetical protein